MWEDPIIKELHAIRAAHAAQFDYDIDAMFQELQEKERQSGIRYVSCTPQHVHSAQNTTMEKRASNKKHERIPA